MKRICVYIILLLLFNLLACEKNNVIDEQSSIILSDNEIKIEVGKEATLSVSGSEHFSIVIDNSIAIAENNGNGGITIHGVSPGNTQLKVSWKSAKAICNIVVTQQVPATNDSQEINNKALRVIGKDINFDTAMPGILYSRHNNNDQITHMLANIDNYSSIYIIYTLDREGLISDMNLISSGQRIDSDASIFHEEDGKIWIKFTSSDNQSVIAVVNK